MNSWKNHKNSRKRRRACHEWHQEPQTMIDEAMCVVVTKKHSRHRASTCSEQAIHTRLPFVQSRKMKCTQLCSTHHTNQIKEVVVDFENAQERNLCQPCIPEGGETLTRKRGMW